MNRRIQTLGGVAALLAAALGLFGLAAWRFGAWRVATFGSDYVPMAPSTAVLFLLLGVALAARRFMAPGNRGAGWIAVIAAVATVVVAGMVVGQPWHGLRSPWLLWFGVPIHFVGAIPIGRMSLLTAGAFLLAALSLAAQGLGKRRSAVAACIANGAAGLGVLVGLLVVLGYVTGNPLGYGGESVPMAFPTALGFLALNAGLLLSDQLCPLAGRWLWWAGDPDPSADTMRDYARRLSLMTAVVMILIALVGFVYFRSEQTGAREQAYKELEGIAALKVDQISQWHRERMGEARFLMRTPAVAQDVAALLAHPHDPAARAAVIGWLDPIKAGDRYEAILVYDAQAHPVLTLPEAAGEDSNTPRTTLLAALAGRTIRQVDLRLVAGADHSRYNLLVPIFAPAGSESEPSAPVALISLRMDPAHTLYPLVKWWPVPSATAESLLVRREGDEVVFLNELRHQSRTALKLRHSVYDRLLPAARVVRGETGVQEGRDYRGVAVLASGRAIPGTPWFLVVKIDQAEVYAAIRKDLGQTGAMVALLLLTVALGAIHLWRQRHSSMLRRTLTAEKERNDYAERLALHTRYANDIILLLDENWRIVEANESALAAYGYSLDELRALPPGGLRAPSAQAGHSAQMQEFLKPEGGRFETMHQRKDGSRFPVEVSGRLVTAGGQRRVLAVFRDLTRRKAYEAEIERFNRLYAALSQVNQAIVHARTREGLLEEICRVLIEFGHFQMAWVGWANPATGEVEPVADCGDTTGYLNRLVVRTDDSPEAQGPTGRAIREQRTQVCNDFMAAATTRPWQEMARVAGIRASIALPIRLAGEPTGALTVYAAETGFFGTKEVALLEEAAMDIAFGLENLARERVREQTELALQASEARFRTIFDQAPVGISLTLEDGSITVNAEHARITGVPVADSGIPGAFHRVTHPDDEVRQMALARRFIKGELGHYTIEKRYLHPDGRVQWAELTSRFYHNPVTNQRVIVTVITDIAERKRAEDALRDSEQRYHTFINATSDLIFLKDENLQYVISNRANSEFLGRPETEVCGRTDFDLMPRQAADHCQASDRRALTEGRVVVGEESLDGKTYQTIKFPVPLPEGKVGVGGFVRDITERKQAEAALRLSEEKYRTIFEESLDGLFITSPDGHILDMNKRGIAMFGYANKEEVQKLDLGRDVYAHAPDRERILALVDAQNTAEYDVVVKRKSGEHIVTHCALTAVRDASGAITSYRGIIRDVTDEKRAEAALLESEQRLRRAITDAPFPIMLHAEDGAVLHVSNVWCEISGYDRTELATVADWTRRAYREDQPAVMGNIKALYHAEERRQEGDFTVHTKQGEIRIWEFSSAPLGRLTDGRRVVISMAMDVTERRQAEEALRASQHLIEGIINAIPVRVFWKDRNLVYLGCNQAFASDAGFTNPQDIVGKDDSQLVWSKQAEFYRADDRQVIESGDPKFLIEESQTTPVGQTITLLTNKLPLRNARGEIYGVLGTYMDITGRKRVEEVLRNSLQEKEALLKEVHHRVKNNLQVITSLLRLEAGRRQENDTKAVLREMQGRIRSMALLHETLYRSGTFARINLADYLRQLATQLFRAHNPNPASVHLSLDLESVEVEIDQAIPCALMVNELLTNALKHAFPAGRSGEVWMRMHPEPDGRVLLQVGDDGAGLPAGFSVEGIQSLGLQLASDLSRQLQGELTIKPGRGAEFSVRFMPRLGSSSA